eukprot:7346890-Prymnesium_polylepis.1
MCTSDVSTTPTLGRDERRRFDPLPVTARAGETQQAPTSLDRGAPTHSPRQPAPEGRSNHQ